MSTSVGNLNATLSLSEFEFVNGLKQSETAAMAFASTTEVVARRSEAAMSKAGGNIGGKLAGVTQQAGFAIQDFSSQFETRGIGPAIGAVSNNVAVLGSAFGPVPAAITAVAAALGGILLPKLLDATGWFGKSKEALSEYRKELDTFYDGFRKQGAEKASFMERDPKELDKELQKKRDAMAINNAEILALNQTSAQAAAAGEDELADIAYKKALERVEDNKRIQREGIALKAARPEVEAAQTERDLKKAGVEREKEYLKSLTEGNAALIKLKQEGLEKFGTESEKLASKQAREMQELKSKTKDMSGAQEDQSRAALLAQQETEKQKLKISEDQKKLNEMGTAAKGSAGVTRGSAEGVNAINRAVTGTLSEQDIAKKSLKTQEESLKRLQEIARQKSSVIMVQLSS